MLETLVTALNAPLLVVAGNALTLAEVLGFSTGLACVWLTAIRNIWNFPLGIANCLLLLFLFFEARLFADTALQVVFITLGVVGWRQWVLGRRGEEYPITTLGRTEMARYLVILAAGTSILFGLLTWLKGSVPIFDAFITAASLVAQWLLNKRKLESWYFWIAVDLVSAPVYAYKGLWLIALLYLIFLALCIAGLRQWRQAYQRDAAVGAEVAV